MLLVRAILRAHSRKLLDCSSLFTINILHFPPWDSEYAICFIRYASGRLCDSPSSFSDPPSVRSVPSARHSHRPSPLHSFIPGLKPSFSANPSYRSFPFLFQDCQHGFLTYVSFSTHVKIASLIASLSSSAANPSHVIFRDSDIGISISRIVRKSTRLKKSSSNWLNLVK